MAEQINLMTPVPSTGGTAFWRVANLRLHWDEARIVIGLVGDNGERKSVGYEGAEATTLMRALNKADFSVKSLHRRSMEKLHAVGHTVGAVSGVPD